MAGEDPAASFSRVPDSLEHTSLPAAVLGVNEGSDQLPHLGSVGGKRPLLCGQVGSRTREKPSGELRLPHTVQLLFPSRQAFLVLWLALFSQKTFLIAPLFPHSLIL